MRRLQRAIYDSFEYESGITEVHSPIEHALRERRGVCQDFAHIMIAIARAWGVPARYVSGYMYHRGSKDRSKSDATHAWVEAYLPSLGWLGFDPTNNIPAGERHVRAAVGRDYADVPPTRGTFKGAADSELSIAVAIEPTQAPVRHEDFLKVARPMTSPATHSMPERIYSHQQQQQQQ
jgi:transglutaminase-like putative cysteine protease